jgi:peptidoglycan hydrolase CwlO-like protein
VITLEQIRLLEGKITRALELIRVLKEENATLRKGLESAQKRMKELEALVDGFKADQREIESVIVRTMHHLDELEEGGGGAGKKGEHGGASQGAAPASTPSVSAAKQQSNAQPPRDAQQKPAKEELDIF